MNHGQRFDAEGEVFDNHTTTTDVVDGFERKSFELLEYINTLEAKLDQQRCQFKEREKQLEEEKICVEQKFEISLQHTQLENARLEQDRQNFVVEAERSIQSLWKDVDASDSSLRKEKIRVQDLQNAVTDLKHQLHQKQQSYNYLKTTHENEMGRLEEQVNNLRKKVSLGCILGHLTEGYLRMDPLQQSGGRSGGVGSTAGQATNMHRIENDVRGIIDSAVHSPRSLNDARSAQPIPSLHPHQGMVGDEEPEIETRIVGNGQNNIRPPNACATLGLATTAILRNSYPSKSPAPAIRKTTASSPSPPRSPKKDVTWFDESSTTVNSNASVHRDISNRQRGIHHSLISTLKSQTKFASNL